MSNFYSLELIGRHKELARLDELIEQISVDQGQIAGIIGEAGIGKSRLTVALKGLLKERGIAFSEGTHRQHTTETFQGFRQIVLELAGGKIETLSRWEMTEAESDFLRLFIEPNQKIERLAGYSDEQIRQGLFHAVRKFLHSIARSPLVLILEDLHWAENISIDLLEYVMEEMEQVKLLIVLVHRPDLQIRWDKRLNYNRIPLQPLSDDEIDRQIRTLLNVDKVSHKMRQQLTKRSLGNPLFIEELTRQLLDREAFEIETDDEGHRYVRLKEDATSQIPVTLHALISSRLDQLESEPKEAIRWASLFGSSFNAEEWEALLKQEFGHDPKEAIAGLFDRGFLDEKSVFPSRINRFHHDLVFDAVRETFSETERTKRHTKIGRFLRERYGADRNEQIERIAEHLLQGDDEPSAIEMALEAGHKSFGLYQYVRAVSFYEAAEERWRKGKFTQPKAEALYAPLIQALLSVGELEMAKAALGRWETAGINPEPRSKGTYAKLKMRYHHARSQYPEAVEASAIALEAFSHEPLLEEERFEIIHDRVNALAFAGRMNDVLHEALAALRQLNDGRYPITRLRLWSRIAHCASSTGDQFTARSYLDRSQALLSNDISPKIQLELAYRTAGVLESLSQHEEVLSIYTRAIQIAEEAGLRQDLAKSYMWRAGACEEIGNYEQAIRDYESSLVEARQIRDLAIEIRALTGLMDAFSDIGATIEAEEMWKLVETKFYKNTDQWEVSRHLRLVAFLCEQKGDMGKAADHLRKSLAVLEKIGDRVVEARTFLRLLSLEGRNNLRPMNDLVSDYHRVVAKGSKVISPFLEYERHVCAYDLSVAGGSPNPGPDRHLDPMDCNVIWLRQHLFVSKIEWLDTVGEKNTADELREIYRKERERIAKKIPDKYKEAFFNHALYRVP